MAKIQLKSDNINPFGGLFPIFKQFDRSGIRETIDSALGKRGSTKAAFTYGDVFASLFGIYLCGGDCIEDVMEVKSFWDGRDKLRICSSDVALRTLRKLSSDNVTYKSTQNKSYDFNTNERMNSLLLKCLRVTGLLCPGDCVSLDFDHQFIAAEKKDAKYSYKQADGYFPGVASIGGLIVEVENRDGNANVKFHQADTLERIFTRLETESGVLIENFRADCGSFSGDILKMVSGHCERFYIRANNCQSRRTEFMEHGDWTEVTIGGQRCGVASFKFDAMLPELNLRLVVQRTPVTEEDPDAEPEGRVKGLDRTARLKRFMRCFVIIPAKWIKSGRQNVLNMYTKRRIYLELAC